MMISAARKLLGLFRLILMCAAWVAPLHANQYSTGGSFIGASWPWYAPSQLTFTGYQYSGTINVSLANGPGASKTNATWMAYPDPGLPGRPSFDIHSLLYSAIGGNWATFSGTIALEIQYNINSYTLVRRTVFAVRYSNGVSLGYVPTSIPTYLTGFSSADGLSFMEPSRIVQTVGGPVQLATGAESATRRLFSFNGARSWAFDLTFNSVLARRQLNVGVGAFGYGWTHAYDLRLATAGANLNLNRGGGARSVFVPEAGNPGSFISTDDNARYDRIAVQTGGGWLLTRRDQSSLLFNSSGLLIEDRDPQGRKLVMTYTSNRLTRITEPVSNTYVNFTYNGSGQVVTLADAAGATVTVDYHADNPVRLKTITNQRGYRVTFSYTGATMALLTLVDETTAATLTANTYDSQGRVISQDDGLAGNQPFALDFEEIACPGSVVFAPSDTARLVPLPIAVPGQVRTDSITWPSGQTITYAHDANGRLVSATTGGQVTTLGYDASGNVVSLTDPAGVTTPVVPRVVTTVTDRAGKQSAHTFDVNYNLISRQDALDHVTHYTYDTANRLTSATDPLNRTTSFTYDAQGNVLTATDAVGKITTYTYDAKNNLLTTTEPGGGVTTRTYDSKNNLLTLTDALGRTTTWTYNADSQPLTMTLPGGGVQSYVYTTGRLTQITDPNGVVTHFGYDTNGRLLYREDALGKRVTYTYDAIGNVLTVTNALNETTTYTYDHRNRVATVTDPAGAVTTNTYDHNHNLLTATVTATGLPTLVTTYTYDAEDRLKTVTTPDPDPAATGPGKDPLVTTYNYDDAGRLTSVEAPNGTTTYAYDDAGQLVSIADPAGKVTTREYDPCGLLTRVTDPLLRSTDFTYDDLGRRQTVEDPLERLTTFEYDALHRLIKVTDPGSLVAEQGFDVDGNRTSLKNPAAAVTAFAYDAGGRLTTATTPEGRATAYTYDSRGLLATVTEPSTQATTFGYDDAQRLASAADAAGTITYGRDSAGRVTTITESASTLTRAYDAYGRLTSFTDGDGNVIGYSYDDLGRLTTLTYPGTPLKEVNYTYDAAGRLHTVTDWASRVTTYSYDAVGRLAQMLRPNGTKQVRTYDDAGQLRLLTELAPDGTTVLYSAGASYDLAGQLTSETLQPSVVPQAMNVTQSFDADNRLLTHNGAAATFDADGNLLTVASGVTPASYAYDARNRLTAAGGLTYGYDAENRRVSVTDGVGTTTWVINPHAVPDQALIRTTPDGTKTFYVYGLGLLHEETGSTIRYYHHSRRGDTVMLTDDTGAVTDRASYGVYGELLARTGTTDTPFLFNGRWGVQTDANGLYFHRARYYHSELRRFLNQDTVLGSIGDSASMNRFAYANGNPVSLIDPFGLAAYDVTPDNLLSLLATTGKTLLGDFSQTVSDQANFIYSGLIGRPLGVWQQFAESFSDPLLRRALEITPDAIAMYIGARVPRPVPSIAAETTTLYRAVSPAEAADALANGLRAGPNSYSTGKFFAESAADAAKWGKALEGEGKFQLLKLEFPKSTADTFMRWERLDGIGPARFGTFEQITTAPKITPLGPP